MLEALVRRLRDEMRRKQPGQLLLHVFGCDREGLGRSHQPLLQLALLGEDRRREAHDLLRDQVEAVLAFGYTPGEILRGHRQ